MSVNISGFGATLMLGIPRASQLINRKVHPSVMISLMTKKLCSLSLQICQTKPWSEKMNRPKAAAFDSASICQIWHILSTHWFAVQPLLCTHLQWISHLSDAIIPQGYKSLSFFQAPLKGYLPSDNPRQNSRFLTLCLHYFNQSCFHWFQGWTIPFYLREPRA